MRQRRVLDLRAHLLKTSTFCTKTGSKRLETSTKRCFQAVFGPFPALNGLFQVQKGAVEVPREVIAVIEHHLTAHDVDTLAADEVLQAPAPHKHRGNIENNKKNRRKSAKISPKTMKIDEKTYRKPL